MKMKSKIIIAALMLIIASTSFLSAQKTEVINGFKVIRGERPFIDLSSVSVNDCKSDKISIKLSADIENKITDNAIISSMNGEYVKTGVASLDEFNIKFKAVKYKPLIFGLYDASPSSVMFRERHKAWGLNLWMEITFEEGVDIIEAVKQYGTLKEVQFAEPVYKKVLFEPVNIKEYRSDEEESVKNDPKWTPNDTRFNEQWHYNNTGQQSGTGDCDIDLPEAWNIEKGNPQVIVCVEDGGIQYDHPDISGNMWSGRGYNFVAGSSTIVPHYHGTHVAGTISGVNNNGTGISGIAGGSGSGDGVRLMSCQVFTDSDADGFAVAPVYAADNGAAISQNSWGYTTIGYYEQSVLDAIDYFNANGGGTVMEGGLSIYSAGNSGGSGQKYPGCYSGTLSVAATNNSDIKSFYSTYDTWVDVSAPGGETNSVAARGVLSTYTSSGYSFLQGTSMACPHTSGVAALILSLAPGVFSAQEVQEIIMNTTDNIYGLNPTYTGMLGTGRLNAYNALIEAQSLISGAVRNPVSFSSVTQSKNTIELNWVKNADNDNVMIVWSPDGTFGIPSGSYSVGQTVSGGGKILYMGSGTAFTHTGLNSGTSYYYKAWSYNIANEYSLGREYYCQTLADYTIIDDFETGDFSANDWYFIGNANWFIDGTGYNSSHSARSGSITHSQSTSMKLDLEFFKDGEISFYRKVSSESGYDYLEFYIDGTRVNRWSGTQNWLKIVYPVNAGVRTLTWRYMKDSSVSSGSDCAWVDDIMATGTIAENTISILSPNGGEVLSQGSQYEITWTDNFADNAKIELYKDSLYYSEIVSSTESDGSYSWTVPNEITGTDYRIMVTSVTDPLVSDMSDNNFAVIPGLIAITSPVGGEKFLQNTQINISWLDNIAENVIIELYKSDALHSVIKSSTPSSGSYLWTIPTNLTGQDFKIKLSSVDFPDVHNDFSDSTFSLLPGRIAVLDPNGGEILISGMQYEIKWLDYLSENVKIELYQNNILHSVIASSTPSDGSYFWINSFSGINFKIKISSTILPTVNNDYSDGYFSINERVISLTGPVAGTLIEMYETNTIGWTDNIPEDLVISLYKDSVFVTSFSTPSTGICNWHFYSDNLTSGNDYKIRLESSLFSEVFDESDYFTIKGTNNVNGSVSGTWSEEGSPYIITGNSYISQSDTLIINPKVKVKGAHGNDYLNVQGKLASNGLLNEQVKIYGIDLNFNNSGSPDSSRVIHSTFGKNEEFYIYENVKSNLKNPKTVFKTQTIRINENSKVIIQNCLIENISNYGIIVNNAFPAITNNLIANNHGGIKLVNSSSSYIINNTIADNDSIGLFFDGNSDGMFINNIVFGNGLKQVYMNHDDSDPDFYYNNIQNGQAGFGLNTGVIYTGTFESNIDLDPLYEADSYIIQQSSPCVNTGYPDLTYDILGYLYIPHKDIIGNFRLNDNIDMGCYENWASVVTPEIPTNVLISENAGKINIVWDLVENAYSYYIYGSDNPYGVFDCVSIVDTNFWSVSIETNTRKFYYIVSSSETIGKNIPSAGQARKKIKIKKIEDMLR